MGSRAVVSGLVVLVGLGAGVLTGCGTGPPAGPPVVVPGGPGEAAQVLPGAEAAERRTPTPTSPADVAFVDAMIPHHRQALEMAALAPGRASDPRVLAIADRIVAAQGPEIAVMQAWLAQQDPALGHGTDHGDDLRGDDLHGGDLHPGMATPAQLTELAAAAGPAFDRLFLQRMIAHHEGALAMADEQRLAGTDLRVAQLADDVTATQSVEIERMRGLLV